jgi:hypothetical protein
MQLFGMQSMIIIIIFNMLISYFLPKTKLISLFCGLFNDETDLRVRYTDGAKAWLVATQPPHLL